MANVVPRNKRRATVDERLQSAAWRQGGPRECRCPLGAFSLLQSQAASAI